MINKELPGYTLIELLIAVTIFAGLIILALAIFAQTINAGNKDDATRQQVQAARSVTDQISSDFSYLAPFDSANPTSTEPPQCSQLTNPKLSSSQAWDNSFCAGSSLGSSNWNTLYLLLKYPNSTSYTEKEYLAVLGLGNDDADVRVWSVPCNNVVTAGTNDCTTNMDTAQDSPTIHYLVSSVSDGYVLDSSNIFSESQPDTANAINDVTTITNEGYLGIDLMVKSSSVTESCAKAPAGSCYTLSTKLVPGGLR